MCILIHRLKNKKYGWTLCKWIIYITRYKLGFSWTPHGYALFSGFKLGGATSRFNRSLEYVVSKLGGNYLFFSMFDPPPSCGWCAIKWLTPLPHKQCHTIYERALMACGHCYPKICWSNLCIKFKNVYQPSEIWIPITVDHVEICCPFFIFVCKPNPILAPSFQLFKIFCLTFQLLTIFFSRK